MFVIDQKDPVQDAVLAHQVFRRRDLFGFLLGLLLTEQNGWHGKTCADCAGPQDEFATAAHARIAHANLQPSDTLGLAEGCCFIWPLDKSPTPSPDPQLHPDGAMRF